MTTKVVAGSSPARGAKGLKNDLEAFLRPNFFIEKEHLLHYTSISHGRAGLTAELQDHRQDLNSLAFFIALRTAP
jgi:hypothetical protein